MENVVLSEKIGIEVEVVESDNGQLFFRVGGGELEPYDEGGNNLRSAVEPFVRVELDAIIDGINGSTIGLL